MKNVNFVSKDIQRILSSHKISGKYNEQEVFYKKICYKNFAIFTGLQLFEKVTPTQVFSFEIYSL